MKKSLEDRIKAIKAKRNIESMTLPCNCYLPSHSIYVGDMNIRVSEDGKPILDSQFREIYVGITVYPVYFSLKNKIKMIWDILTNGDDFAVHDVGLSDEDAILLEDWLATNRKLYEESNGE